ncbi:MAG: hypothetical protein BWY77_01747 [bacterium ADurb.Bin431]|nr:MAG: hypothetical protein BWY77_01747 [bacterium ADurb.Bin431]
MQRFFVLLHIGDEIGRHRLGKAFVRLAAVIACIRDHADLVLHLDHDHRLLLLIHFAEMAHQGGEGAYIGLEILRAERSEDFLGLSCARAGAGEAHRVRFHPEGRVAGHAVLPGAEPEQDELEVVGAGGLEDAVDERKFKTPLLRLDQLPVDGHQGCVEMHVLQLGPDPAHRCGIGGARIAQFTGQHEQGLAPDDELDRLALLAEMGDGQSPVFRD